MPTTYYDPIGFFSAGFFPPGSYSPGFWTGQVPAPATVSPAPTGWASVGTRSGPDPASALASRSYGLSGD